MNNDKKLRFSTKTIVILSVVLILANVVLGLTLTFYNRQIMSTLIDERMLDIANTAADTVDGDILRKLTKDDYATPEYISQLDALRTFQENIELEYIYAIYADENDNYLFSVDPTVEDPGEFGTPVVRTSALEKAFGGEPAVDENPYEDEWGTFYSAYSPVYDSDGNVAAVVAVDFDAAWFDKQVSKNSFIVIAVCLLSMIMGVAVVYITAGRKRKEMALSDINDQANRMITALSSDYRSVYYIDLDKDEGICYRKHTHLKDGIDQGEHFVFSRVFEAYAYKYVSPEARDTFRDFIKVENIRKALEDEVLIAYRYPVIRDGHESYEMIRMAAVRRPEDRYDHVIHALGVGFTDVDKRTREAMAKNQALADALASAEEANNAKTAFLSRMSHEIRTPMNAILGLDHIALSNADISETTRDQLEKIDAAARHLLSILNDILDMSQIQAGSVSVAHEEFSLDELLEQLDASVGPLCDEKSIAYERHMSGDTDEFYIGDGEKLRQILDNIISNAVKFTPEQGSIKFSIERLAHYENRTTLKFTVSDSGIGMDQEFIPRIFETFSQENEGISSDYGSTGLGLSITKNLVDMMNGKIDVDSIKGQGSTFRVTLTFDDSKREAGKVKAAGRPAADKTDLTGKRILLAEDMPVNAEIIKMVLQMRNMVTEHAENGRIAVEMFADHPAGYYDAILMDLRMPEMDGLTATVKIREMAGQDDHHDAAGIPIIALTANAFAEDVQRSLQSGLNAHLSKPVEPDILFSTLEEFISKAQSGK